MERKNDKIIFLLIAAGLGIYWFMKNKATQPATTTVIAPNMPETALVLPINEDIISTQPVYEQPIYQAPITEDVVNTQYVYDQYVYEQPNYTAPVSEMIDSLVYFGGNKAEDKYK